MTAATYMISGRAPAARRGTARGAPGPLPALWMKAGSTPRLAAPADHPDLRQSASCCHTGLDAYGLRNGPANDRL